MVKYRLRLKGGETINKQDKDKYGISVYELGMDYLAYYDDRYSLCEYESLCYDGNEAKFNQDDIDRIPSGMLEKLDVIEAEEQLYYIKLPHIREGDNFLNQNIYNGEVVIRNSFEGAGFKTKFTKKEIKEKYPFYANDICMVKVEDVK